MSKKLVSYFSASGMTKRYAEKIAKLADADLFEIVPKEPYTKQDLDWQNSGSRSSVEMNDPNSRPEIAGKAANINDYEVIFVGFPIWWYVAPTIIDTFLESYDFTGKTIVPFATSGGSGMGKTVDVLKKICPNADIRDGKVINGMSELDIRQWIENF